MAIIGFSPICALYLSGRTVVEPEKVHLALHLMLCSVWMGAVMFEYTLYANVRDKGDITTYMVLEWSTACLQQNAVRQGVSV